MNSMVENDMAFCTWHFADITGEVPGDRAVLVVYDNRDCDAVTGADRLFPLPMEYPDCKLARAALRAAAWPATVDLSSTFGYPGEDRYSEFWRDTWGRRFLIERRGVPGISNIWSMREVRL